MPVATIEATLPNAADVKAKAAEAVAVAKEKVAEVAEKAIEAATPVKVEPAKKESVKEAVAAAPTEELVVKGETHYYGSSPGASVAAWSAEAVLNPDYDTGTDDPVADTEPEQVAEAAPIAAEAAREPAKTASGATAYYGVSETPDVEHDWAAEAEMNPDYEATPAESEVAVEVRELYKTEPGVTAVFGGESWQAPENYYAPAVAPVVVAEAPREPYKTEPGVTANFGGETWQAPENYYAPAEAPVVVAEAPREPYKTEVGTTANFGGSTWQAPANYYAPVAPPCSDALASALKDGKINFETSSWEIDSDSFPTLDKIVKAAKTCGSASIEVGGHTDSTGKPPSNQTLSEMRAKAVMNYLVDHGVPAAKIKSVGFGQDKPIADNGTREGKAQNRRIEFVVTPG